MSTATQLSLREYAKREGISLQAAYLRVWNEKVTAVKDGRAWRIVEGNQPNEETEKTEVLVSAGSAKT